MQTSVFILDVTLLLVLGIQTAVAYGSTGGAATVQAYFNFITLSSLAGVCLVGGAGVSSLAGVCLVGGAGVWV